MKQNKSKIRHLRSVLLCLMSVLVLTACGDGKVKPMIDNPHEQLDAQVALIAMMVSERPTEAELAGLEAFNEDQLEAISSSLYSYYQLRMDGQVYIAGVRSYSDSYEEIGPNSLERVLADPYASQAQIIDALEIAYDVGDDEVIAEAKLHGDLHEGEIEVIYDKNLHVTSITTNVNYGLGESMRKAGENTLIGMGTVFVMLILISFIIRALVIAPKIADGLGRIFSRKSAPSATEENIDNAIAGIIERETAEQSETDDLELVAVISAAIAAMSGASPATVSTEGFVVRSIRRVR